MGEQSCLYYCVVIIPVLFACMHTVASWRVIFSFEQWASNVFQMFKSFKLCMKSWFDLFLFVFIVTRCSYGVNGCILLHQTKNKVCSDKVYLWSKCTLTFVSNWFITVIVRFMGALRLFQRDRTQHFEICCQYLQCSAFFCGGWGNLKKNVSWVFLILFFSSVVVVPCFCFLVLVPVLIEMHYP